MLSINFNPRQNQPAFGMNKESAKQVLFDIYNEIKDRPSRGKMEDRVDVFLNKSNTSGLANATRLLADQLAYSKFEDRKRKGEVIKGDQNTPEISDYLQAISVIKKLTFLEGFHREGSHNEGQITHITSKQGVNHRNTVQSLNSDNQRYNNIMNTCLQPIEGYPKEPELYTTSAGETRIFA